MQTWLRSCGTSSASGATGTCLVTCTHPMVFLEFRDTAFVARDLGSGEIAGYLLGFVAPAGDGYMGGQGMPSCFNRWIAQAGHQVKLSGTDRLIAADSRSWE